MGKGKSNKKTSDQDFEPIIQEFQEMEEIVTPGSQWVNFLVTGALTSGSVTHLFSTPLFVTVTPQVGQLLVTVLVASILLAASYNDFSLKQRKNLFATRESPKSVHPSEYKAALATESTMYAFFTTNAAYLFGALTFAVYILPVYGFGEAISSALATIAPAVILFGLAKSGFAF